MDKHYTTMKYALAILLFILSGTTGAPSLLAQIVPDENRTSRYFGANERPLLAPTASIEAEIVRELETIGANTGVEVVYRDGPEAASVTMLEAANLMLSFSRLEGLQYYSASRNTMRLLFSVSHVTEPGPDRPRLPDPQVTTLPARRELYVVQEDLTFGTNLYVARLDASDTASRLSMENLTPYRYGPVRIIRPGNMRLWLYFVESEGERSYYGVFGATTVNLPFLEKKIHTSFTNRIDALHDWFVAEVD